MQRGFVALLSGFVVAGLAVVWPASSFGAAQVKLGKSGYSGTLSSDPITRQQQLLCDPDAEFDPDAVLVSGSMSTYYNAGIVTLRSLVGAPGFTVTRAYVQVQDDTGKHLVTYSTFSNPEFNGGVETGYLQVFFQRVVTTPPPSVDGPFLFAAAAAPPPTYTYEDRDGTNGDITHELVFKYKSLDTPLNTVVQYTNFADFGPDRAGDGNAPDSLTFRSATLGDVVYTADQIDPATVSGDLVPNAAPLPSAALGGLALLGGLGLARRHRGVTVQA